MGITTAVKTDVGRLHAKWMGIIFPAQENTSTSVLGKWQPQTTTQRIGYLLWGLVGYLILALGYPLPAAGALIFVIAKRVDKTAASLGILGVAAATLVFWGLFTAAAYVQLSTEGFIAVGAASGVATLSAALSRLTARIDGRPLTVFLSHPLAVTVFFLPPVTAALYSPTVAQYVFPRSTSIAVWILNNVLWIGDLSTFLQNTFELEGAAHLLMWFVLAFPVGWFTGTITTIIGYLRSEDSPGLVT